MRLRLVTTAGRESVAVEHQGRWAPLASIPGLDDLDVGDMVAVLGAPDSVWDLVQGGLADAAAEAVTLPETLPCLPLGLRSFPLWRGQLEAVAQVGARRFGSAARRRVSGLAGGRLDPSLIGSHWARFPLGIRGNHIGILSSVEEVPWPSFTQALDLEFGLAAVVAHEAEAGQRVLAREVIGGYTIVATAVARDLEHDELFGGRLGPSVSRDIATVMASEVVTHHALPSGRLAGLSTSLTVGDELWSQGSTDRAQHSLDDVLTRAAQATGLIPGELVVVTAMPGGSTAPLDRWVSPGDLVTFEVGTIGRLAVQVGQPEPHLHPGPLQRRPWTVVERRGHGPGLPPLDPVAWEPPAPSAMEGALAANNRLDAAEIWATPGADKPEDVVIAPDGSVLSGVEDGRIHRWAGPGSAGEVIADTHGRPLGLEVTASGDLVICDADRGLLRLPMNGPDVGELEVLACEHAGLALKFTNNAAIASDRSIYFSDSSTRYDVHSYRQILQEHEATGRIFRWQPGQPQLELVLDGLHFPNGVALSPEQDALLWVQTTTYSLHRYWLAGPRAGEQELLSDQLPGFVDNMCPAGDGTYWIAVPNRRVALLDAALPHPLARRLNNRLPEALQPQPDRYSIVLRVDGDGQVVESLHGPSGAYAMVTGMRPHDGWLYLSSLLEGGIARVPLHV